MSDHYTCDQCGELCQKEVFFAGHFKVSQEGETINHFCSKDCRRTFEGIAEEITLGIEKGTRKEVNLIYKMVCPKDQQRLRRLL